MPQGTPVTLCLCHCHNAKVDTGDDDVNEEELLRWFNWQESRAGVMEEIKRRWRRGTSASTRYLCEISIPAPIIFSVHVK